MFICLLSFKFVLPNKDLRLIQAEDNEFCSITFLGDSSESELILSHPLHVRVD